MYDLLIRGALIADGLGGPLVAADVAVAEGRIAAVGDCGRAARQVVDAGGLVVSPGIIDIHTHYDAQLTWDVTASPSPALGATTVVIGNCGFGIAPCPAAARDLVARNLSAVEGMPLEALSAGIVWNFESFPQYLELLRSRRAYPNVAAFIGHSPVRSAVMGEAASERAASDDEVAAMTALVRDGLRAGAIGFASSTSENHNGHGGVPMPSRLAAEGETRALVGALGDAGRGLFQITVGPATTVPFLESLAAATGRPVVLSALFHNEAFPDRAAAALEACRQAQGRGRELYAQVSCQPLAMDFTLANAYPLYSLEAWQALMGAPPEVLAATLREPGFRDRFRAGLATPRRGKLFYGDWRRVEVALAARPEHAALEGLTIAEIAGRQRRDPVDVFFDLALAEDLATHYSAKLLNVDEAAVEPLLKHPASLISLSDAGAHLAHMCDAGFGLRLLGYWSRERGVFGLGEAVHELTARPAAVYRLADRGRIAAGAWADLMLFDPARVGVSAPLRRHDLPGGASRLVREAQGLHGVWVNGVQVFDGRDYLPLDPPPGRVLDSFLS